MVFVPFHRLSTMVIVTYQNIRRGNVSTCVLKLERMSTILTQQVINYLSVVSYCRLLELDLSKRIHLDNITFDLNSVAQNTITLQHTEILLDTSLLIS